MSLPENWLQACDELASELLQRAGIEAPPVDAFLVSQRLRILLAWDAGQEGRARLQRLDGTPMIFVRPDDRPERVQWAAAHELGETHAVHLCPRVGISVDEFPARAREAVANHLANRLLVPTGWLIAALSGGEVDLTALKQQFMTASHELLAWRLLDLETPRIVTVWDHAKMTRRRWNRPQRCPNLHPVEDRCQTTAHQTAAKVSSAGRFEFPRLGRAVCSVWPIHEPEWKREIAITTVDIFIDPPAADESCS